MRFSRIGEHTIKCIITEEEIGDLGFTLDEIMSNGERTQEFMNHIFDLAEQEFQMKFDMGVKTVRADFMSDHTLSLTFSEHPGANGMMEHLKDIVNGLLNSVPKDKWEALQNLDNTKGSGGDDEDGEPARVVVTFIFSDINILCRFAKLVRMTDMPWNALYRWKNRYYLIMDLSDNEEADVKRLSSLTDEYAQDILVGSDKSAFLEEHAKPILRNQAIEQLRQL